MKNIEKTDILAQEILSTCGGRIFLHIGSGNGKLVQTLLANGIDAYGFDQSFELVASTNKMMPGRFIQGNVKKLPYLDKTFDTTILLYNFESISLQEIIKIIKELKRVTRRSVYFRVKIKEFYDDKLNQNIFDGSRWESLFFSENFRKHPSYYLVNDYSSLSNNNDEAVILLECLSRRASECYPIEMIKKKRDLHMDMTRETGERSDAHIFRYQWATTFVRPGDTVLDVACGLGYGSYILQCNTMAAKTTGIDSSSYAIEYANINFSPEVRNLTFLVGILPEVLYSILDNSVDVIVSFETLEHIIDPENLLKEFYRILTPAGRIIVSVPNDWSDETGEDPNPFHLHVYTLDKFRSQLKTLFDLESIAVQSATRCKEHPGSKKWIPAKRELYEIDVNINQSTAPPSEWWLAVGMKSPLDSVGVSYRETQYKTFSHSKWNVTAFSRDYKNPWLIKGMVDILWRQKNKVLLSELAEKVIYTNYDNSADVGAALCVKGYQFLNAKEGISIDIIFDYVSQVDEYVARKPETPHAIRWLISLYFVIGKLWLQAGMHDNARIAFMKCVEIDPLQFSPLLFNRVVEAYLFLGKLYLISGDEIFAREAWILGIETAKRAVTADWQLSLGDISSPAEFALPELSSILDYASNCAYGITNLSNFQDKPWWWLHLQQSLNSQFILQKKQEEILKQELTELKSTINKQTAEINECRAIKKTRFMKLRNTILYQPLGIKKVLYISYLIISLLTPYAFRNKLQPVIIWLRSQFLQHPPEEPTKSTENSLVPIGYQVKKPASKQGAPKIVHMIANFMTGGSSRLVVDLVEYLGNEYEQFILTSYAPNPPAYIGLDIEEQNNRHNIIPFINYLKEKSPDFVHVHYWGDVDESWYAKAIEASKILSIPVIENINALVTPHVSDIVKRYVYVSNYVRRIFGRSDIEGLTIYPGSDFSHFMRADDDIVPSDCVGMVYRLEHDKLNKDSITPFILIAKKRPKTKILIVGGGSLLSSFKKKVQIAGVKRQFEFTGYVDYATLPDYYRRMSLFIAPVWKESFGQVGPFAMNMRIPVIGYDVGAISEIVDSKEVLAPGGDAKRLADIAIELLDNDELRTKIGNEHQKRAREHFSIQGMIKAYSELYAEMKKHNTGL